MAETGIGFRNREALAGRKKTSNEISRLSFCSATGNSMKFLRVGVTLRRQMDLRVRLFEVRAQFVHKFSLRPAKCR